MNLFRLIDAFYTRQNSEPLSAGQIALWFALVHQDNQLGWADSFNMPSRTLELLTGLSRSGVAKARKALQEMGFITFETHGVKATTYQIIDISTSYSTQGSKQDSTQPGTQGSTQARTRLEPSTSESTQGSVQGSNQGSAQGSTPYTTKTKTRQDDTSQTSDKGVSREQSISAWENLWGFPNAFMLQDIFEWCKEFGDDLVAYAIQNAGRHDVKAARANRYLETTMSSYRAAGIDSVEKAEAEAERHRQRVATEVSQRKAQHPRYGKQPVVEQKPSWEQEGYKAPSRELTPEEHAAFEAQLASLRKPKEATT